MFPNGVVVAQQTLTLLVVGSIPLSGAKQKHIDHLIGQDGVLKALNVGSTPTQCVFV